MKILKESLQPSEGFFWIVSNQVIGFAAPVSKTDGLEDYKFKNLTHENTWGNIKSQYGLDEYSWDYFPRGRVMVDADYNLNNEFTGYTCVVFLDSCIYNIESKQLIADYYNLNLPTIPHIMWMNMKERTGINHYTCHNCR